MILSAGSIEPPVGVSFIVNIRTGSVLVLDLDSCLRTMSEYVSSDSLTLDQEQWVEGTYLRGHVGIVFRSCRDIGGARDYMEKRWPTFTSFERWALRTVETLCLEHPESSASAPISLVRRKRLLATSPILLHRLSAGTENVKSALEGVLGPIGQDYHCYAAHIAAMAGTLASDFGQWQLLDSSGVPVVLRYIRRMKKSPPRFRKWETPVFYNGNPVPLAHVLAAEQHLPLGFRDWGLRDSEGNTVAHIVAKYHEPGEDDSGILSRIPKKMWLAYNRAGYSVLDAYLRRRMLVPMPVGACSALRAEFEPICRNHARLSHIFAQP